MARLDEAEKKKRHAKAVHAYQQENTKFIGLRFNIYGDTDYKVLARLDHERESGGNMAGYIKNLVIEDIKRTGFDPGPKPTKPGAPPDPSTLPPVEPVPTVDMDEWRKEHPELIPPEELSKEKEKREREEHLDQLNAEFRKAQEEGRREREAGGTVSKDEAYRMLGL